LTQLTRNFPESVLVPDANLELLYILYENGNYEAVIARGSAFVGTTDPNLQRMPFFLLIGDAYEGLGAHMDAARFYYRAWNTATGPQREAAWPKLESSAGQLNVQEIQQLISELKDRAVMGLLLYRLGMSFIMDENYDDAFDVLEMFVNRFPEHPDHQDAVDMILSLEESSRFTPFTVGCLLPLSGPYAVFGQRALNGIELALNQAGEMAHGIPFTMIVKDSRSDAGVTAAAIEELDRQRVGTILGPMSAAEAAGQYAQTRGIPIVVFTQREEVPDIGSYVFRNFITPQMQVRSLVTFAVENLGSRRFAILYPDEKYGWRYMNLFWDQVVENGGTVNAVEAYDPTGTDFAEPIKNMTGLFYEVPADLNRQSFPGPLPRTLTLMADQYLQDPIAAIDPVARISGIPLDREALDDLGRRNSGREDRWDPIVDFDAVFIPDAPKKAGLVIPQLAYYDIRDVYLLGTNLWNSKTLLEMSGEYMKNTLIADAFFTEGSSAAVKAFVADFTEVFGRAPGIIEALAYDSAMMVFSTMRQTATDSRRELKQALLQMEPFKGVTGPTRFQPNGEVEKALQMLRIERGRFVQAQPTPALESDSPGSDTPLLQP
jgi:branched-chain amino acid transport system substrate-binding protein